MQPVLNPCLSVEYLSAAAADCELDDFGCEHARIVARDAELGYITVVHCRVITAGTCLASLVRVEETGQIVVVTRLTDPTTGQCWLFGTALAISAKIPRASCSHLRASSSVICDVVARIVPSSGILG